MNHEITDYEANSGIKKINPFNTSTVMPVHKEVRKKADIITTRYFRKKKEKVKEL